MINKSYNKVGNKVRYIGNNSNIRPLVGEIININIEFFNCTVKFCKPFTGGRIEFFKGKENYYWHCYLHELEPIVTNKVNLKWEK